MDDASYFLVIRLGPKTSECEKNVIVMSTVTGCEVSNCATTLHGFNKHVRNLTEMRRHSLELPCWEVGRIFTYFEHKSLQLLKCSCASPILFAYKFHSCFKKYAQHPSCSNERTFGLRLLSPPRCIIPKVGTFLLALVHKSLCDASQSEVLDNIISNFLYHFHWNS